MKKENSISRRSFLKSTAMAGALGAIGTGSASVLTSCAGGGAEGSAANKPLKEPGTYYIPELPDLATDGKELKAGVIGCGGRGSGAAFNFLNAANGVTIVALGDTFQERVDSLADKLKSEKNIDIPADKRFVGLDAYQKVIDSGVDVVIIATPPVFRPLHFQYATEKGKHSFLEKPICVDPVGYRTIMATAKQAQAKNLCVLTGTQRHHQRNYVESYKKIMEGAIGEITGGVVYWNGGKLWHRDRQPGWNDCEAMIKDWVNWKWLSGDHIVEQHVHNIDVFTWFSGLKPVSAVGFGSRQRRVTGDQYDNFSIEFAEKAAHSQTDPYTLEHVNWINCIRGGKPLEQASETAIANMAAIMGRESAYTGLETTWDAMTASPMDYTPKDLNLGKMDMSGFTVAIPGKAYEPKKK